MAGIITASTGMVYKYMCSPPYFSLGLTPTLIHQHRLQELQQLVVEGVLTEDIYQAAATQLAVEHNSVSTPSQHNTHKHTHTHVVSQRLRVIHARDVVVWLWLWV
jgi:hypothetical protein